MKGNFAGECGIKMRLKIGAGRSGAWGRVVLGRAGRCWGRGFSRSGRVARPGYAAGGVDFEECFCGGLRGDWWILRAGREAQWSRVVLGVAALVRRGGS